MRKVWITGTSEGLGKALAEEYLMQGWQVEGLSRRHTLVHKRYTALKIDLSQADFLKDGLFDDVYASQECLLILNAGVVEPINHCGNFNNEEAQNSIAVNYSSVVALCNAFLSRVKNRPEKLIGIIYISSGAARKPYDGWSVYCSSKAASEMFMRCIAEELKAEKMRHIQVYSIAPGLIDTGMQHIIRETQINDFSRNQHFIQLHKEGALLRPEKVAAQLYALWQKRMKYDEVCLDLRLTQNL
jgi:benzil reductase ((S)-benzoin forming)